MKSRRAWAVLVIETGRSGSTVSYYLGGNMPSGQVNANLRLDGCTMHGAEIGAADGRDHMLRVTIRVPGRDVVPPGGYAVRVHGRMPVRGCSGDNIHDLDRVVNIAAGDSPDTVLASLEIPLGYRPDSHAGTTIDGEIGFEYVDP